MVLLTKVFYILLVLLTLGMACPVFAWTTLSTTTTSGTQGTNGALVQPVSNVSVWMRNISYIANVTKIHADFTGTTQYDYHSEVYTASGDVWCGVTKVGTHTTIWNHPGGNYPTYAGSFMETEMSVTYNAACGVGSQSFSLGGIGQAWKANANTLIYSKHQPTISNTSNYDMNYRVSIPAYSDAVTVSYGGSSAVGPVVNFTNMAYPKTCYSPGEYVVFNPNATTGTKPFTYFWNLSGGTNYTDMQTSTVEFPSFEFSDAGLYSVELNVTGVAGWDTDLKSNWLEVALGGNCTLLRHNVTPIATIALVPTGFENIINRSHIRNMVGGTFISNLSDGWFNASDFFADGVNATVGDILGIFTTPIDWLALAVGTVFTDIQSLVDSFIVASNFFLQMISRALAALPVVIINIVTLGLLVDVVRLILAGREGME